MDTSNDTPILIPLTKGKFCIVDPIDADLASIKWCVISSGVSTIYFYAKHDIWNGDTKKKTGIRMHRIILERKLGRTLLAGEIGDHINGDTLDNRRANLRLADHSKNQRNCKRHNRNRTGYKGVTKYNDKYGARICVDRKLIWLGVFDTPEEAHHIYCQAASKYFGEFANSGDKS